MCEQCTNESPDDGLPECPKVDQASGVKRRRANTDWILRLRVQVNRTARLWTGGPR